MYNVANPPCLSTISIEIFAALQESNMGHFCLSKRSLDQTFLSSSRDHRFAGFYGSMAEKPTVGYIGRGNQRDGHKC